MRWRPMNPEHGMCATIGMLTSRADNIALAPADTPDCQQRQDGRPTSTRIISGSPSAVTASINLARASSGELDVSPQVSRPLKAGWRFT